MAIDAQVIPNALKGFNTPFERLDKQVAAEQTRSVNAARDAQTSKLTQEAAERQAIQQVLQESGGDLSDATLNRITQVAPALGVKFRGDLSENREKLAKATSAEADAEWEKLQQGLAWLNAAKQDPSMYPRVRAMAISKGGDLAQMLLDKPTYDPAVVDTLMSTGLKAKERIELNQRLADDFRKGEFRYLAGALNAVKDEPDELKELVDASLFMGVPKAQIDALLVNPQALSMTETERQTQAGQAEGREIQRAGQAVTLRGQDLSATTQRRGQDLSAATARAGQAITARGQDMTARSAADRLKADAATGAGGAKLSAAAIEKIAGADTALGSLDQIDSMYDKYKDVMGPVAGRVAMTRQQLPGADAGLAEFAAEVATLKNAVIKATTGAAMSEPEAQRIMSQIPDITNQPEVFKARMGTTRRNLDTLKRRTIELSGGTVPDAPKPPGGGPEQRPIPGVPGGVAELRNGRWIRVK